MSTYAVFGMTRSAAIKLAESELSEGLSVAEMDRQIAEKADEIMQSTKSVMLSDKFDAPQFAKDFLSLCKKNESRSLHIKAYVKTGRNDNGRDLHEWRFIR